MIQFKFYTLGLDLTCFNVWPWPGPCWGLAVWTEAVGRWGDGGRLSGTARRPADSQCCQWVEGCESVKQNWAGMWVCEVLKPLIYEAKPPGAVHNAFNASGENGFKCLRDLTFLLEKTRERSEHAVKRIFPSTRHALDAVSTGVKNMITKNTSTCSCLESTNGPSCRGKETWLNPTHRQRTHD